MFLASHSIEDGVYRRTELNLRLPEHARRPQGPVRTLKNRTETLLVAWLRHCKEERKERSVEAELRF
jgi:hypothetical protein